MPRGVAARSVQPRTGTVSNLGAMSRKTIVVAAPAVVAVVLVAASAVGVVAVAVTLVMGTVGRRRMAWRTCTPSVSRK